MDKTYKRQDFTVRVYGTISGVLYDGRDAYRDFERLLTGKRSLEQVIRDQCSKDFDGGGKVTFGYLEVTYHKADNRRVVRDFALNLFPSISKHVEF